jgi:excisionase family DNA binding protein
MPDPVRLPRLMTERIAAQQLGCSVDTLRRERQAGKIKYTMIRGRVRYTETHLASYIEAGERGGCQNSGSEKSADAGSAGDPIARFGAEHGSTELLDRRAAHLSAQMILSKPN